MQITLTLRGILAAHLPPGSGRHTRRVEVSEGATIEGALAQLRVPGELAHLVLLNGEQVPVSRLANTPLRAEDTLAIWPPLSGG